MDKHPKIRSCMKRNVVFARVDTLVGQAAALMVEKRVGTLPSFDCKTGR